MNAAPTLAKFANQLRLENIPKEVIFRAQDCVIDTVAVASFGSQFPWSQTIAKYACTYAKQGSACESPGKSRLFGMADTRLNAPYAALANGAFSHAFEQDSLRKPGAGVHPGATVVMPALAIAEEVQASGKQILLAVIAACEVMFRIGAATLHSSEKKGFHAPGLTGPFGSAIATGILLGLNEEQLTSALGIAGSLSSGLLAFTSAQNGAEVKRLHLGRASESGILAARLAQSGFQGPETILEGRFGFLPSYCSEIDPSLLTANLNHQWETLKICLKSFPCHVTAHTPIESLRELMRENGFSADDVDHIEIEVSEKVLSHHNIVKPNDIKQAQYSVPFCVAWALHHDPYNPNNLQDSVIKDPKVKASCESIQLSLMDASRKSSAWASWIKVHLKNGTLFEKWSDSFTGTPAKPYTIEQLRNRFYKLTSSLQKNNRKEQDLWWEALSHLEQLDHLNHLPDLII